MTLISSDCRSQIFEEKKWWSKFEPNGPKSGRKLGFYAIYVYNDSLQQCLTFSGDTIYEKFFFGQRGQNQSQN